MLFSGTRHLAPELHLRLLDLADAGLEAHEQLPGLEQRALRHAVELAALLVDVPRRSVRRIKQFLHALLNLLFAGQVGVVVGEIVSPLVALQGDVALLAIFLRLRLHSEDAQVWFFLWFVQRLDYFVQLQFADSLPTLHRKAVRHRDRSRDEELEPKLLLELLVLDLTLGLRVDVLEDRLELVVGEQGSIFLLQLGYGFQERQELRLRHRLCLVTHHGEQVLLGLLGNRHVLLQRRHNLSQPDECREALPLLGNQRRSDRHGIGQLLLHSLHVVSGILDQSLRDELVLLIPKPADLRVELALCGIHSKDHLDELRLDVLRGRVGPGLPLLRSQQLPGLVDGFLRGRLRGAGLLASGLHGLRRHVAA
mmetsp:Transcript_410/g.1823  ORF Transcript_410/g.1823 Transcript_410/m.1823 type:complete len:366 (+) Transcript_410:1920-3017(+)